MDSDGGVSRSLSNTFIVDTSPPTIIYVQHGYYGKLQEHVTPIQLPYKLCIFTFPYVAMDTFGVYEIE